MYLPKNKKKTYCGEDLQILAHYVRGDIIIILLSNYVND